MKKAVIPILLLIGIALGFKLSGCNFHQESISQEEDEKILKMPNTYVGSKQCAECHDKIYYTWKSTKHPYKITLPDRKTVVGDFWKNNKLEIVDKRDGKKKVAAVMSEENGKYYVSTFSDSDKMEKFEIAYNIGGVWKQRYLTKFSNGALNVLPVQWNVKTGKWVDYHGLKKHAPGDGKYWSDNTRTWQKNCAKCHVTGFEMNENNGNFDSKWVDNGASCEACHGPGMHHVNVGQNNKINTIYNPGKDHDDRRANMVCGQCHSRGKSPDKKFGYPNSYQVGDELTFHYDMVTPEKDKKRFWPDGSSKSHHQQFIDFQKSVMFANGVKCWSCHDPHKASAGNSSSLRLTGNMLCQSCHGILTGSQHLSHDLHDHGTCQSCHMPKTAKSATAGDISSHTFFAIPPTATEKFGKGNVKKQPNSCNLCHYHKKTPVKDLVDEFEKKHHRKTYGKYSALDTFYR